MCPSNSSAAGHLAQALLLALVGLLLLFDGFRTVAVNVRGPYFDLHGRNTAEALRQLIPALREGGYRFVLPEKPSP